MENKKQVIGVDTLTLKSTAKPQPAPLKVHRIAMQVNELVLELERITNINQELIIEIKKLKGTV